MHSAASATFPRANGSTVANGAVVSKHPAALAPCAGGGEAVVRTPDSGAEQQLRLQL